MSGDKRKPLTREQLIIDIWTPMGADSVGAAELELIQEALLERFGAGASESPASIARTLADNGARLEHPQILEADLKWRERNLLAVFMPDELSFDTLAGAAEWVERVGSLHHRFELERDEFGVELLRRVVLGIKRELELVSAGKTAAEKERRLAQEVAHWLAIWLQNPLIFEDWLSLRRDSSEFREQFGDCV